jgi:hypothetical protein
VVDSAAGASGNQAARSLRAIRRWRIAGILAMTLLVLAALGERRLRDYEQQGYKLR